MFKITNRMKRLWNLPGTPDQRFPAVSIGPGETVEVDSEQWGAIVRDNPVIAALLAERSLVVGADNPQVDSEELTNPPSPSAPEELTAEPENEKVKVDLKPVQVLEIDTEPKTDGPAEVKPKPRKAK